MVGFPCIPCLFVQRSHRDGGHRRLVMCRNEKQGTQYLCPHTESLLLRRSINHCHTLSKTQQQGKCFTGLKMQQIWLGFLYLLDRSGAHSYSSCVVWTVFTPWRPVFTLHLNLQPFKIRKESLFPYYSVFSGRSKGREFPTLGLRANIHTRDPSLAMGSCRTVCFYINSFYLNCPYVASGFRFSLCILHIVCLFGLSKICQFERFCPCSSQVSPESFRAAHSSLVQYDFSTILYSRLGLWHLKKERLISQKVKCINNQSLTAVLWRMLCDLVHPLKIEMRIQHRWKMWIRDVFRDIKWEGRVFISFIDVSVVLCGSQLNSSRVIHHSARNNHLNHNPTNVPDKPIRHFIHLFLDACLGCSVEAFFLLKTLVSMKLWIWKQDHVTMFTYSRSFHTCWLNLKHTALLTL